MELPRLREMLNHEDTFKDIYQFAFSWGCPAGQKSMPVETAVALWRLLFMAERLPLAHDWCQYIEENRKHAISRDEWTLLLEFLRDMDKNLTQYDSENSAWPVVIDTFAEYMIDKKN